MKRHFIVLCLASMVFVPATVFGQVPVQLTLSGEWKFAKGPQEDAWRVDFDDSSWRTLSIPHDWAIEGPFDPRGDGNTARLPWKGEGWYRYDQLYLKPEWEGMRFYLLFDGVMAFPSVYVNGRFAGRWDYGYNSFYLDITPLVEVGRSNAIAVHADTRQHDSRWYPGAGLYRKVQLLVVHPIHLEIWGTQVTTPIVKPNYAKVHVMTAIVNETDQETSITIEQSVVNAHAVVLAKSTKTENIPARSKRTVEHIFTLTDPVHWDIGKGIRYEVKTSLRRGEEVLDMNTVPFGVRTIRFTADDGFYINDRRVQLKGVCLHHDQGPLGAAFDPEAMERQLSLLVEMGCNAIRTSHNVPAPELLELCDRRGILVLDEIFDKYDRKADITDTTNFDAFAERNVRNFIRRDRNHPCIFLWSVGNEIGDVQWNLNGGFSRLRTMVNLVRKYDPSRPVTLVCDSRNSAALRHFDYYDVHSWNYGRRYDLARQLEPNKAVIISESASTVSTRGFYEWPLPEKKTDFTWSGQVSSYDLHAPDWAEIPDDDFMWQQEENYVAGEFVWTGFDYLGEPTPYDPWSIKKFGLPDSLTAVSSYFGIFDLVGLPKDRYYLYKSYWKPQDTTIHIVPHWTWPGKEGVKIPVYVYTNGDCAALFLNGTSLGTRCKIPDSPQSTERFRLLWKDVPYQPGELKAIAYKEGKWIGEERLLTAGPPSRLKLTPDRRSIRPHGLCYVTVEAVDKDGNICPDADAAVQVQVEGPARIAGVGNGNPQATDSFQSDRVNLFHGKAVIILRAQADSDKLTISAVAKGMSGTAMQIDITAKKEE